MRDYFNKIILYDDKNMQYITGEIANVETDYEPIEVQTIDSKNKKFLPPRGIKIIGYINNPVPSETIKLDETLMKRIAKYNKEAEIEKYNIIIEEKKEKIKELDDILKDREKRVEKLKKFIAKIYDMDIEGIEDEDYF